MIELAFTAVAAVVSLGLFYIKEWDSMDVGKRAFFTRIVALVVLIVVFSVVFRSFGWL